MYSVVKRVYWASISNETCQQLRGWNATVKTDEINWPDWFGNHIGDTYIDLEIKEGCQSGQMVSPAKR